MDAIGFRVETPAVVEPWRTVLLDAADRIEERGWCQMRLQDDHGRVCARGAMMLAVDSPADWGHISKSQQKLWREADLRLQHHLGTFCVGSWNNTRGRTASEVTAALRACARS